MNHFRLKSAEFDFGTGSSQSIDFVATPTGKQNRQSHFTLLMGANGAYKSRTLAGCIDLLRHQYSLIHNEKPENSSECCLSATIESDGSLEKLGADSLSAPGKQPLPSRILALSNLVRDRFTFGGRDEQDDPNRFYHYLGVRQATNLTTTGAMDRIVADAFLEILPDLERRSLLFRWIGKLFPKYELAFGLAQLRIASFDRFLDDPVAYYEKLRGTARSGSFPKDEVEIPTQEKHVTLLKKFLRRWLDQSQPVSSSFGSKRSQVVSTPLNELSDDQCSEFAEMREAFDTARRLRLLVGPYMLLRKKGKHPTPWLELSNLSSGEQNLISTGARLIAHAKPRSFIAIDEPELSLNVAWQQRYIELISSALSLADGSHVIVASHSPHLVSSLVPGDSSVVVAELVGDSVQFETHDGSFFGWGSEAILYKVLDIPSASNFEFSRELSSVLLHIQGGGQNRALLDKFLNKCERLQVGRGDDALATVISEISAYRKEIGS